MARSAGTLKQSEPEAPVAVYRRVVDASLERIWENVLDWEHLPWLHSSSFKGIDLLESGPDGWRARVSLPAAVVGSESSEAEIEVRLERSELRYTTRTLSGVGEGTEIVTQLEPLGDEGTRIEVEFYVPGVDPSEAGAIGEAYSGLYARLWDEDEAMMVRRQRFVDRRPRPVRIGSAVAFVREPVTLGTLSELRERLPLFMDVAGHPFRVIEVDGRLVMHSAVCPHLGGPLDLCDADGSELTCPWHGYRFDACTGKSTDGRKLQLAPAPRLEVDEETEHVKLLWG